MESKKLDKFAIAAALQEISALLELKGGVNRFKARAYQTGARAVVSIAGDIGRALSENRLTSVPGIGNALASQIRQLHLTGTSSVLDKLKAEFPPGIIELSRIQGLSTSKISKLHESLGISSLDDLKTAATAGKVRNVAGFGAKTEQSLLEAIADHDRDHKKQKRLHLHQAERIAEQVITYIRTSRDVEDISIAGALRRGAETVGTIRLVACAKNPAAVVKHLLRFPLIIRVDEQTDSSCEVELAEGAVVFLKAVKPNEFGLALFFETGSQTHVTKVQEIAGHKGLALDHDKLKLTISGKARAAKSRKPLQVRAETELYPLLGMQYIAPELRED